MNDEDMRDDTAGDAVWVGVELLAYIPYHSLDNKDHDLRREQMFRLLEPVAPDYLFRGVRWDWLKAYIPT